MDTWLEEEDIARLFKIVNEELTEDFTTHDEVMEFKRLIDQVVATKPLPGYNRGNTLQ
jgi:hypothetical protein